MFSKRLLLAQAVGLAALCLNLLPTSGAAAAPNFDCAKASSVVEKTICANATLAELDQTLAARYRSVLSQLSKEGQERLRGSQRQWLRQMGTICDTAVLPKDRDARSLQKCLLDNYESRLKQLDATAAIGGTSAVPFDRDFPTDWTASAINCSKAKYTPDTTICEDAGLKQTDIKIADAYRRLSGTYKNEDQSIFQAGQQLWIIERDNCRNLSSPHGTPGIFECVQATMSAQLETLTMLTRTPSNLKTTVANYPFVYPSYISAFAQQYAGKVVNVFGEVSIEACKSQHAKSLIGHLSSNGKLVEVRFKSLPPEQIDFLCSKQPTSWWDGEFRTDNGRAYLFATDILGDPLP